jgi:two-component system CheB/CheR fusion protein
VTNSPDNSRPLDSLRLVAIGASAGGLEPLQSFFGAIKDAPKNTAFVVIQHLSPDYKSMMGELLARTTSIPIATVEDGTQLEAGHIYLIPPRFNIFLRDKGTFGVAPKPSGVVNLPIDVFVASAAGFYHGDMIAVILSGTGSDGVRGVVEVNAAGGLALAQSPESAQFDGMPNSAIATGFVDRVGEPPMLAESVVHHLQQSDGTLPLDEEDDGTHADIKLGDVLHELKRRTGIPFDLYKKSTVARRVERRMALRHCTSLGAYLSLMRDDPSELETLRRETLIGVTSFFRDPESFEALRKALADIVASKRAGDTVRVWVAGCSTGEEAYSIAMLADECINNTNKALELKVFATDLEQTYLDIATTGTYPESIRSEVSDQRLKQYFTRVGEQLRIRPELRKTVIFARHNMISDAPFTKVDLVSCRNTLIYFESELQEVVLKRFQYALGVNGVLFLGSSESLGRLQRDFTVINSSARIFRALRPAVLSLEALQTAHKPAEARMRRSLMRGDTGVHNPVELAQKTLVEEVAPVALLLTRTREIMHVFGDVSAYMKLPRGEASLDVSRMLDATAASALLEMLKRREEGAGDAKPLESQTLRLGGDEASFYRLRLQPLRGGSTAHGLYLLAFVPVEFAGQDELKSEDLNSDDAKMEVLQNELSLTRQNLQNTIEELEASNEELQATNEELLASNEELQSTNEELQSVNEELYTVNSEYQEKIRILDRVNEDLDTMAMATGIPTLFLDENVNVVRFTPTITEIYPLRDSDIGRGLDEFSSKIGFDDLPEKAAAALQGTETVEMIRENGDGRHMLVRIVPYSETAYGARALVIMFIDVANLENGGALLGTTTT